MPRTRGWLASERIATTRSRTLATWSPWGSKIGSPTSRAAKTREGVVLTTPNYRPGTAEPGRWHHVPRECRRCMSGCPRPVRRTSSGCLPTTATCCATRACSIRSCARARCSRARSRCGGVPRKFGLDPRQVDGTWAALCQRARDFDGTTVISHEVLGRRHGRAGRRSPCAADGPGRAGGGDRPRPRSAGDRALAGGGQAGGHDVVRRVRARAAAGRHRARRRVRTPAAYALTSGMPRTSPTRCAAGVAGCRPSTVHLVVCPPPDAPRAELWNRFAVGARHRPRRCWTPRRSRPPTRRSGPPEIALAPGRQRGIG